MAFRAIFLGTIILLQTCIIQAGQSTTQSSEAMNRLWKNFETSNTNTIKGTDFPYIKCFQSSAKIHNLPVPLLLAMARGESNFDPVAVSKANAHGIMQILWPGTAKDLGFSSIKELQDPCKNIAAGAKYVRWLLDRYNGNYHLAVAAYNYGPGNIKVDQKMPNGAIWYSSYIYDHLDFVLDFSSDYNDIGERLLLTFSRPYQAKGYTDKLQSLFPELRFDWFRKNKDYSTVLIYSSDNELRKAEDKLRAKGYI